MTNEKIKLAVEKMKDMSPQARREVCSDNRELFMAWYFPGYIKYKFAPFHFEMFQDLRDLFSGSIDELIWCMFRESAKTSIAKIAFITHTIVYGNRKYINVDSFDKANAESILFDVSNALMTNKKLIRDFGQLFSKKRDKDEQSIKRIAKFITTNGILVEAHSTQESVRGRLYEDQRPDMLLLDDFETNKTKDSLAYTEQVKKHISEFQAGLAPNAIILYLCNYITELGSVQGLMDRAENDYKVRLRMVGVEDEEGNPVWPSKYVKTDVESDNSTGKVSLESRKRKLGSVAYSAEMLNQPIDAATQEFKKTFFRYKTREYVEQKNTVNTLTIDPAASKKDSADNIGFSDTSVDSEGYWYVSAWKEKMSPLDLINKMFILHAKRNYRKIGIEKGIYNLVFKPFLDEEMRKRGIYLPIVELDHKQTKKEERIRGLLPIYESGTIYHIEGECGDLEDELLRFPRSAHDDVMDAHAYQIQIAVKPKIEITDPYYEKYGTYYRD